MKNYLILYHTNAESFHQMSEENQELKLERMQAWLDWNASIKDKLVDFGAPLTNGFTLGKNGLDSNSREDVRGYFFIQAENEEEAKHLLKSHPHLNDSEGSTIEVYECFSMENC